MRVCILGSGLSALALAKALVNENIYVDMVSQNTNYKKNLSRTIGISKSNFEYLNKYIVNIEKIAWKLKKIEIFTENLKNEKLLKFENNDDQIFSIIKNYKFYEILKKSLFKNKFFKKTKIIKDNYNLIINTEFSNHFTRKYFSKKIFKTYNSFAYTALLKHEKISNNIATQIFTRRGPLAFLPISEIETSIVYSINSLKKNNKENINQLIEKYNSKYKIKKIENSDSFELKSLSLRSYYYKNILAFGDLLHKIHPLAGQGFNMTIRDIKTLIKIIKYKTNLGLPLDSSVNKEFEKLSKHKNFIFSNSIDLIHEFFNFERQTGNTILSRSIKVLGKNSSINTLFKKIADKGVEI